MTDTLINGQRINLSNYLNGLKQVKVEINYEIKESYSGLGTGIYLSALCLGDDKKFINELYLVNHKNNKTPDNGLAYYKSIKQENLFSYIIDFSKFIPEIKRIIFVLSTTDLNNENYSFDFLKYLEINLSTLDGPTLLKFRVPVEFTIEKTIEIFEIYNKESQWKAVAHSYGYIGGLGLLTEKYGLKISEEIFPEENPGIKRDRVEKSITSEPIDKKLKIYREKLLDLSRRNPLINIKPKSIVKINIPDFHEVFMKIAENNETLVISPLPEDMDLFRELENEIISDKPKKDLTTLLYRLRHRATSSIEEQGVNILFLAFGLLNWAEREEDEEKYVSPLILVPVELSKTSLYSPYKIKAIDDDIIVNPALQSKLFNQFGIEFPVLPEELNIITLKEFFIDLLKRVKDVPGVSLEEKPALGIFSFNKLVLYNDLESYSGLIKEHPLLNGKGFDDSANQNLAEFRAENLDDKISSKDTFQVVDADSSQQEAIILAKKGVSFVLQGPPGTGKSQTITNIIAECISEGKSVLFVSEKMAALEVVKKRLENCGLGDFCLELHSNKTAKKEVLASLEKGLQLEQKTIKQNVGEGLDRLDKLRKQLNNYIRTLHEPRGKLGISTYEAQSQLVKLNGAPLIFFEIPDILNLETGIWSEINQNLNRLAGLKTFLADLEKYPWKNINLESLNLETETLIGNLIDEIIEKSNDLNNTLFDFSEKTKLKKITNSLETGKLISEADFILTSPQPLINWLNPEYNIEKLKEYTNGIAGDFNLYNKNKQAILEKYKNNILNQEVVEGLNEEHKKLLGFFGRKLPLTLISKEEQIKLGFEDINKSSGEFEKILEIITGKIGVKKPENFVESDYLFKLLEFISNEPQIQDNWFDLKFLSHLFIKVDEVKDRWLNYTQNKKNISEKYNLDILSLDVPNLLNRFETDYNSIFRSFNPVYKADLKQIAEIINKPGLNYKNSLDLLKRAEIIYKEKNYLEGHKNEFLNDFGTYYKGESTDWNQLKHHIEISQNLIKWFAEKEIPVELKSLLKAGGLEFQKIKHQTIQLKENYSILKKTCDSLLNNSLKLEINSTKNLQEIYSEINNNKIFLNNLWEFHKKLKVYQIKDEFTWETIESEFSCVLELIKYEKSFNALQLEKIYAHYFKGFETDWENILKIINWTIECKTRMKTENWNDLFGQVGEVLKAISSKNELFNNLQNEVKSIKDKYFNFTKKVNVFLSLFKSNIILINGENINLVEFGELNKWFSGLKENFNSLREWFLFLEIEKFFRENSIPGFIEIIQTNKYYGKVVIDSFKKRFYQLWLDNVYKSEPLLKDFNGEEQMKLINEFALFDLKSIEIARARLQVKLRKRIPKQDFFEMQSSEYGILNTEITKKRKHKPLRKLFGEIKNLLFTIKPCFMMSPVSVCQFIDPLKIKFDIVVFDEASQIFPEDAVSAILRAKQAIIVGDKKQMPPSNFFRFVEDEGNDEFSEGDVPEYESILDEFSNMGLPSRMLQWHYRSRDENLIAFSNKHFYENRLWTFPNKTNENPAIEFIKVEGVYDRGFSRQNRIEAAKIAELVFAHFNKHSSLSLGVITFSEAQQMAILNELEKKRMEDQSFESLFESKDSEKFFVKSIEHVQGDERDVIFFSICYGKDQNNKFSYFFGPLNLTGGERRLNVAVTRARQHIKLVSSITYKDIDPERLNARGAKLLRNYLEYAERGRAAIFSMEEVNTELSFDSPFEERVYEELSNRGFILKSQVGSSGYRIDLAVVDQDYPGRFLLGIECDGATYHSAKTARDRDRLRQQILEGLGWKIHRIWSRDWVSRQENEIQKIIIAVEAAKNSPGKTHSFKNDYNILKDSILSDHDEPKKSQEISLKRYEALNPGILGIPEEFYLGGNIIKISNSIYKIVSKESPVHLSSITKRIIAAWGMTKAGAKIQATIKNIIYNLNDHIRLDKDGFLWDLEMQKAEIRIPGDFRDINEISREEIAEAATFCLSNSFSAEREELIKVVGKLFDFQRITPNIKEKINSAINSNIEKGHFIEEGNFLKLKFK